MTALRLLAACTAVVLAAGLLARVQGDYPPAPGSGGAKCKYNVQVSCFELKNVNTAGLDRPGKPLDGTSVLWL